MFQPVCGFSLIFRLRLRVFGISQSHSFWLSTQNTHKLNILSEGHAYSLFPQERDHPDQLGRMAGSENLVKMKGYMVTVLNICIFSFDHTIYFKFLFCLAAILKYPQIENK